MFGANRAHGARLGPAVTVSGMVPAALPGATDMAGRRAVPPEDRRHRAGPAPPRKSRQMKPGSNPKRFRGGRPNNRHRHGLSSNYESNGPDVKVRGSAAQVHDRYQLLSRDALAAGDRVAAESYLQHAEHYQRIINAHLAAQAAQNAQAEPNGAARPRHDDEGERRPRRNRPRPAPEPAAAGEDGVGGDSAPAPERPSA